MMYGIYNDGTIKPALGAFATTDPVEGVSMAASLFDTVNSLVSGDKTVEPSGSKPSKPPAMRCGQL